MNKRYKKLDISGEVIADMFKKGIHSYEITENWLPDNAKVIDVYCAPKLGIVTFVIESEKFPEIDEHGEIPQIKDLPKAKSLIEPNA